MHSDYNIPLYPYRVKAFSGKKREWTLSTITPFDDLEGEAGGHPRAQYRTKQKLRPNRTHEIKFNVVLPKDWQIYNKEVAIFDIHGHKVAAQTMDIFIKDDHFLVIIKDRPGPAVHSRFMKKFITEHPYEFRLVTHITNDETKGYYKCFVNEQEWFYIYWLKTMFDGEDEEGPYWKVGL